MSSTLIHKDFPVLFSEEQIHQRIAEIGKQIDADYAGKSVVLIGVLKGAAIFLSDLARAITVQCTFDFVAVSSYGKGQRTSGAVKLIKDLDQPIEGKHIIVVEDILDTGLTLNFLRSLFGQHRPASLRIAALLDKPSRRLEQIEADYVGFKIPNHFVIGYGMDYAERFRNVPDIRLMPPDYPELH
ncbi:hypoxanthine phosphoribosyltransferase [Silvibacterium dinghuense]|uniref:Hypoxanthine phosphoribosyltransferase n=1 Tax=Silvibacterium dinghuense TaxID=1560006 RepID=A0A4Q1SDY0_9BACT|nr:hypoxanthine phosphoribosyltransferase [Silvibacterium dinghuense]RXS95452.1 hypoxanthine phosphoribosyltransferase [Silvibacterium dinghuense]GGH13280.1 hypoxanthine phosphoribosyltransferase [Silvibacterium dinghuense]